MEPQEYQKWLSGGAAEGSLAENGEKLFAAARLRQLPQGGQLGPRAPTSPACSATTVQLAGGGTVKADEAYIRESILQPRPRSWPATSRSCPRSRDW